MCRRSLAGRRASSPEHSSLCRQAVATTAAGRSALGATTTSGPSATSSSTVGRVELVAVLDQHLPASSRRRPAPAATAVRRPRRTAARPAGAVLTSAGRRGRSGSGAFGRTCWAEFGSSASVRTGSQAVAGRRPPRRRRRRRPGGDQADGEDQRRRGRHDQRAAVAEPILSWTRATPTAISAPPTRIRSENDSSRNEDAEDHGDDRDDVGGQRGLGRPQLGQQPVVEDVRDAGADHAEQRRPPATRVGVGSNPSITEVTMASGARMAVPTRSWPVAATTGGMSVRWRRM